jgi:hypothetical protein
MIDFEKYKLTLPVTADGEDRGRAAEVRSLDDARGFVVPAPGGGYIMSCPDGGATTATAKYARTEFKNLVTFCAADTVSDKRKFAILHLPVGEKVVVHQVHGENDPWVKIVIWKRNAEEMRLYALTKDESIPLINLPASKAGARIASTLAVKKGLLTIQATMGMTTKKATVSLESRAAETGAYFKHGNYFQNTERKGRMCVVWQN